MPKTYQEMHKKYVKIFAQCANMGARECAKMQRSARKYAKMRQNTRKYEKVRENITMRENQT